MARPSPPSFFVLVQRTFTPKQLFVLFAACALTFVFGRMTWKEYSAQAAFESEGVQARAKVTGRRVQKGKDKRFYYLNLELKPDNTLPVTTELRVDEAVYRAHPMNALLTIEYRRSDPQNVRLPTASDHRRFGMIMVGLPVSVVLLMLLLAMVQALRMKRIYTSGVVAQGKVTKLLSLGKLVEQSSPSQDERWRMHVSFTDGEGVRHHGAAPGTVDKNTRRPVGAEVTIYYDAKDPKRFVVGG